MKRQHGSTLLIVMWALFLLAASVFTWSRLIQEDIQISGQGNREVEARAMAHSGVAIALHPLVTQKTPLLEEQFSADLGFKVRIVGEGGRLNLNWLLAGEDPRKITILRRWLEQMNVSFQDREVLIDSLLDYVDGDNVKRLHGIEDEEDYHPPNRQLQSVDEITEVANSELLTSKPGWREQLTIYSQGPIDLSAADGDILKLLPGISEASIERFLTYRRGKDKLDGTIDDPEFKTQKELTSFLGINEELAQGLFTPKDPTMHIISQGTSAKVIRHVEVVARKGGASPAIVSWKE